MDRRCLTVSALSVRLSAPHTLFRRDYNETGKNGENETTEKW